MTNVVITRGKTCAISMVGHAGHAKGGGGDIVCAACSVLIQSLANTLHVQGIRFDWEQKAGEAHIRFAAGKTLHRDLRALGAFEMTCVGLEMLAQAYPDNVKISE